MKRTLLYFLLAFIAVILAACELNKNRPGKIIFDRVPFVYATINGQRELFLIDTGASTSMLDKKPDSLQLFFKNSFSMQKRSHFQNCASLFVKQFSTAFLSRPVVQPFPFDGYPHEYPPFKIGKRHLL